MRGEYSARCDSVGVPGELPPRARRILAPRPGRSWADGTTSACAENTAWGTVAGEAQRNYLRVRGEYALRNLIAQYRKELPPRARRIPCYPHHCFCFIGTTSACAENTVFRVRNASTTGNYLRVRGEYLGDDRDVAGAEELPPRARRIRIGAYHPPSRPGTTSACAENTSSDAVAVAMVGNYLRVRGEYAYMKKSMIRRMELPPRARRILTRVIVGYKTPRNYLRVRGEYKTV